MVRQKKAYNWPGAGGRAGRATALPLFRASVLVPRQMESGTMIYYIKGSLHTTVLLLPGVELSKYWTDITLFDVGDWVYSVW